MRRPRLPSRPATVAGGAAAALAGQALCYALGFVASAVIARTLGPDGRGIYYLPVVAASTALSVVNLGVEAAATVTRGSREHTLGQIGRATALLAAVLGPVAILGVLCVYVLAGDSIFPGVRLGHIAIAAATLPFALHLLWLTALFVLAHRLATTQLALVAGAVVQLTGAVVLAVAGELTVVTALALYAASIVVPWALLTVWARGVVAWHKRPDLAVARRLVVLGAKFHPGLVLAFLLLRADVFLVALYLDAGSVGIYSLAVLFAELALLLTTPLVQATIPFQTDLPVRESAPLAFKAARFNATLAALVAATLAATLWFAIPLVYGRDFSAAYEATIALMPGVLAMAVCRPLSTFLARQERPLLFNLISAGAFGLNIALNVVLIPAVGVTGAAFSSSIAYAALAIAFVVWASRAGGVSIRAGLRPSRADLDTLRRAIRRRAAA